MGYAPRTLYQNYGTLSAYCQRLDAGVLPIEATDPLSPEMELARQVTSQLRFTKVELGEILEKYGVDLDVTFEHLIAALIELGYLARSGDALSLSREAAPYNNVLPMLFAPDSFKRQLLGLPEEYVVAMPTPYVLTRLHETQSAPMSLMTSKERSRGVAVDALRGDEHRAQVEGEALAAADRDVA
jgi:hypothetical protein